MRWFGNTSLQALVSVIKSKFALKEHLHSFGDFTDTLPIAKGGTGATTRSAAYKNLSFEKNYTCTKVSENGKYYTDLDDFKDPGFYYITSGNTSVNIMSNYSVVNGYLIVLPTNSSDGRVKQVLLRHGTANNNDYMSYVRTYFGSSTGWSDWVRIITERDIMIGAVNSASGKAGLVPAPTTDEQGLYLRGDGIWANPCENIPAENVTGTLNETVIPSTVYTSSNDGNGNLTLSGSDNLTINGITAWYKKVGGKVWQLNIKGTVTASSVGVSCKVCTIPNCSLKDIVDLVGVDTTNNVPITGSISKTGEVTIKLVKSGSQHITINTLFISK